MDGLTPKAPLVEIRGCRQSYHKDSSSDLLVLDDVNLTLASGEIVALLGRSGSGKSTLLRIVSGLLQPTAGQVKWRGEDLHGPADGVAMVFQSFALFPWLTVQENVELGLEAQGIPRAEREARAETAIDLIGLGGYESAYPKELSGGMRQRVGLARALVVHPDLLLMDEPFSALDAQTREIMQTELLRIWEAGAKTVLFVTHQIDEAVYLSDRVFVFARRPGRINEIVEIDLPRPRPLSIKRTPEFARYVDHIWRLIEEDVRVSVLEEHVG
jgi:NitT/TauT family transport system ATP-binding protein